MNLETNLKLNALFIDSSYVTLDESPNIQESQFSHLGTIFFSTL